jgi:hypothetical protein
MRMSSSVCVSAPLRISQRFGLGGVDERDEREREYGDSKTFLSHSWKSHPFLSCY